MNIKFFMGFWVIMTVIGVSYITITGASYSSVTCMTGEVVRSESMCPQCTENSHCSDQGPDIVCNLDTYQCTPRKCFSGADCKDPLSVCEFNKCVIEKSLYENPDI